MSRPMSTASAMPSHPDLASLLQRAMSHIDAWEAGWGSFETHPSLAVASDRLDDAFSDYLERLEGNYPFHHPRYAGQMLKPPHPVALAAYAAAQRINPNNHALDGGPPTGQMEKEVVADLAAMVGFPDATLGHLTSGGTIANLEALWVARETHPDQQIAFSADAHYTHGRMCSVLQAKTKVLPTDSLGRLRLDALDEALQTGTIGTVVLTAGTTGFGSVDPIAEAIALCREQGARVHIDAAYGGFFTLLAQSGAPAFEEFPAASFRAIAEADSVAIDPHKHGLQPYGCGCILFQDASAGRVYQHDSPYTYFTSDELHLGEISLECSRAGAAAGALWCTLRALPLRPNDGLGPVLQACFRAARTWADLLAASEPFVLYAPPETDIVAYFPTPAEPTLSSISAASQQLFDAAMHASAPLFLSLYRVPAKKLTARFPHLHADQDEAAILRSVLMKPEHETYIPEIHERLTALAQDAC